MTDPVSRIAALAAAHPGPAMALSALLGLVLGLVHFASLRRVTLLYLGDADGAGRAPGRALALQLARMAVLALVFVGLALLGAGPLLAGAAGLLLGRLVILRRDRRRGAGGAAGAVNGAAGAVDAPGHAQRPGGRSDGQGAS